ncbi:hypothetical protein [Solimicrobium silvestre]|uniref:Uncharacterized protein n=1 Tax=Solimicrobium silvestre TaxID=2099400 RepID=A0A2S9GSK6_9BURK|nr:hypothetical protein [Solimicrobium silvestre]PRC90685.1 hypothetical protein S2091_4578 [Solimicrobium silvestre]
MNIEKLNPDAPEVHVLITESNHYMAALYPAESNHIEGVDG